MNYARDGVFMSDRSCNGSVNGATIRLGLDARPPCDSAAKTGTWAKSAYRLRPEAENPPLLLPKFASVRDVPGPWIVAHTMSRAERRLAYECLCLDVPYFLPMEAIRSKGKTLLRPIFPGYLFVAGPDASKVRSSDRVCSFIHVLDQETIRREIEYTEYVTKADPIHVEHRNAIELVGHKVEVAEGHWARGSIGVAEHAKREVVTVRMSILGQSVPVDIDSTLLHRVD